MNLGQLISQQPVLEGQTNTFCNLGQIHFVTLDKYILMVDELRPARMNLGQLISRQPVLEGQTRQQQYSCLDRLTGMRGGWQNKKYI